MLLSLVSCLFEIGCSWISQLFSWCISVPWSWAWLCKLGRTRLPRSCKVRLCMYILYVFCRFDIVEENWSTSWNAVVVHIWTDHGELNSILWIPFPPLMVIRYRIVSVMHRVKHMNFYFSCEFRLVVFSGEAPVMRKRCSIYTLIEYVLLLNVSFLLTLCSLLHQTLLRPCKTVISYNA